MDGHQIRIGTEGASAFSTDCWRLLPPSTTRTRPLRFGTHQHLSDPLEIFGAHRDHDLRNTGEATNLRTVWIRIGELPAA